MEKLKELFGDGSLTFAQLEEKLKGNKEIKLANLASGQYVDAKKLTDTEAELTTAKQTIDGLKETVSKFDGVDVEKLKKDAADWETKYNTDTAALKLDSAVNMALLEAKVKNPKLARAGLDMSIIKLDGDKLVGLSEQLETLKASDSYLFEDVKDDGATVTTGGSHGGAASDAFMAGLYRGAGLENKETK